MAKRQEISAGNWGHGERKKKEKKEFLVGLVLVGLGIGSHKFSEFLEVRPVRGNLFLFF